VPTLRDLSAYYTVACRELAWLDSDALRSVLGLVGSHRLLGRRFTWSGGPDDALSLHMDAPSYGVEWATDWMMRVVDVQPALASRGYPDVDAEVLLSVEDDVLPANTGTYALSVSSGRAQVERVAHAPGRAVELPIGSLAPLYSGHLPARILARAGRLDASDDQIAVLEQLFSSGPRPWIMERF
jgi:predicted acetyltransferase